MRLGPKTGYRAGGRVIALSVVVLICFQISRFFLIVELNAIECFDPNHTHGAASPAVHEHRHEHQHDHDGAQAPQHSHHEGPIFQHCKDTFGGAGLTPVQPQGVPETVSYQPPEAAWENPPSENSQPFDNYLPPPFQPPRYLS